MLWTLEFTVAAPLADPLAAARALTAVPGLAALDAYTPARGEGDDPLNPAEVPPALVAILSFDDEARLRAAVTAPETAAAAPAGATSAAFHRHHYPVADGPTLSATTCPPATWPRFSRSTWRPTRRCKPACRASAASCATCRFRT